MIISILVAVAKNNVIGKNNKLIWHLPADLKYFKNLTSGHHMIMGRKTYESIGKPLPNRVTIIITRNKDFKAEGCIVVNSLKEAIAAVKNDDEAFIVGGAEIYRQAMDVTDKIYYTKIDHAFEGDTFFPELSPDKWRLVGEEAHQPDEKNRYPYSFCVYQKL